MTEIVIKNRVSLFPFGLRISSLFPEFLWCNLAGNFLVHEDKRKSHLSRPNEKGSNKIEKEIMKSEKGKKKKKDRKRKKMKKEEMLKEKRKRRENERNENERDTKRKIKR